MAEFVLTEEQYNRAVEEGVVPGQPVTKTVVDANGSKNVGPAVNQAIASNPNVNTIEVTDINNGGGNSDNIFEDVVITKKELMERRLAKLRENSEIILVKDIFKS